MEKLPADVREKRKLLRHFLAALAYRTQKAVRDAPRSFYEFNAGNQTRTPHELICHMTNVLGYARTFFIGGVFLSRHPSEWHDDLKSFHDMLEDLGRRLDSEDPLNGTTEERMLQGPFSDAMTHAGQLAMLRRLEGSPVPPENFIKADVQSENLSQHQANPVSPDKNWPERPDDPYTGDSAST
ncbi:MAG TPA: hypothetical protein VKE93_21075 [Candidatus Angelobacter sp.]|nr:hypothetical protein [Candidatus Angelobacter sp.]